MKRSTINDVDYIYSEDGNEVDVEKGNGAVF